jgi:hypothetical protein
VQDETRERRLQYGYGKDELAFQDRRRDDFRDILFAGVRAEGWSRWWLLKGSHKEG